MDINEEMGKSVQNELRGPLLVIPHVDEDEGSSKGYEYNTMVYFSTFIAVCGSFAFGTCYSWFVSILTVGAMIDSITTSGHLADFFGRKGAMGVGSFFCAIGWLAIFSAQGTITLNVGRLANGYRSGLFSYVVPVFIAEIAPKNLRGPLTSTHELMNCIGVSAATILGTVLLKNYWNEKMCCIESPKEYIYC